MIDSKVLLQDASGWVRRLEDDLRARCHEYPELDARVRAEFDTARAGHRTAISYGEWREEFLTQVAVAWVLTGVFVRFMEDNGLLEAPLLSGPGERLDLARDARRLFFRTQPALSDRNYLEHVFHTVAQVPAVAGLFDERHNPLWTLGPSADGAAALLAFWQRTDPDTGRLRHDFTDEGDEAAGRLPWDTRFLGNLYQDLSESARKRYALLQTPRFVESFILDRTLTPAMDTFGLDGLRLIDPTCGSGHFLLGGFDRIFARWSREAPGLSDRDRVLRTLGSLHGVDLNPFAIAIARFRLTVRALQAAGESTFAQAPVFPTNLAVGDALLHGPAPAGGGTQGLMAFHPLAHVYHTEDREMLERILQPGGYHAVVGNPPYIMVKNAALNEAYRSRWQSCYRKYSLAAPFFERFFHLAIRGNTNEQSAAGFVGMLTASTFMKREFGKKLVEEFLPQCDLTHIIDSDKAQLPGHATGTVIILGKNQRPVQSTIRTVFGNKKQEPAPQDPADGFVWKAIENYTDCSGTDNDWVSVSDSSREAFHHHPWSVGGGGAADLKEVLDEASIETLNHSVQSLGPSCIVGEDEAFVEVLGSNHIARLPSRWRRPFVEGEDVRNWFVTHRMETAFPYTDSIELCKNQEILDWLWPVRTILGARKDFGQLTYAEAGRPYWEFHQIPSERNKSAVAITFSDVASHNHFVFIRGKLVYNRHAPIITLNINQVQRNYIDLTAILNSSITCFWLKQVCHDKGAGGIGGGISAEMWEHRFEFDGTKIRNLPISGDKPSDLAAELDHLAREIQLQTPTSVLARWTTVPVEPIFDLLDAAHAAWDATLARMISLQEELDWFCYQAYGLITNTDNLLAPDPLAVPPLRLGERTFEIFLARQMARGGSQTTWFERHGSTPITAPPSHWPGDYNALYHRRHTAMQDNRDLALIERPEYKRRWNVEPWEAQETRACRAWLLDRLETPTYWPAVALTSSAKLADHARADEDFGAVAERFTGRPDYDLPRLVAELVRTEGVPYLPALRYKEAGRRKREVWEETWRLQREDDRVDAEVAAGPGTEIERMELARERKAREVGPIPVPPKYATGDFQETSYWRLRGKLDVPRERFILYPGAERAVDPSPVLAWAGWNHLQQAEALAAYYENAKTQEGWEPARLLPLLAGLQDLVPWLKQWHNAIHPDFDQRMGDFYADYVESEVRTLGLTPSELKAWEPPARPTGRGRRAVRTTAAS